MHWTSEFYAKIDKGDPSVTAMFAPDISVTVGNHPETRGIEAMMAGELGRHAQVAPSTVHKFVHIWDVGPDLAALDSIVTFNRIDGRRVTIPVLTVIGRNEQQLINRLQLFLDNRPLFEGLSGAQH